MKHVLAVVLGLGLIGVCGQECFARGGPQGGQRNMAQARHRYGQGQGQGQGQMMGQGRMMGMGRGAAWSQTDTDAADQWVPGNGNQGGGVQLRKRDGSCLNGTTGAQSRNQQQQKTQSRTQAGKSRN